MRKLIIIIGIILFINFLYYEKESAYCGSKSVLKDFFPTFNLGLPYSFELENRKYREYDFVNFQKNMILISKDNYLFYKNKKIKIHKNLAYAFNEKILTIQFESESNGKFYIILDENYNSFKGYKLIAIDDFEVSEYYKELKALNWITFEYQCQNNIYLISSLLDILFKLFIVFFIILFIIRKIKKIFKESKVD